MKEESDSIATKRTEKHVAFVCALFDVIPPPPLPFVPHLYLHLELSHCSRPPHIHLPRCLLFEKMHATHPRRFYAFFFCSFYSKRGRIKKSKYTINAPNARGFGKNSIASCSSGGKRIWTAEKMGVDGNGGLEGYIGEGLEVRNA